MNEPIKMEVVVGYYVLPSDDYVTRDQLTEILSNYPTTEDVGATLQDYPTKEELDEGTIVRWEQEE